MIPALLITPSTAPNLDRSTVGDVCFEMLEVIPTAIGQTGSFAKSCCVQIDSRDSCSLRQKQEREFSADSARRSGDKDDQPSTFISQIHLLVSGNTLGVRSEAPAFTRQLEPALRR